MAILYQRYFGLVNKDAITGGILPKSKNYVSKLTELVRTHDLCIAHLIELRGEYVRNLDIPKILEMTDADIIELQEEFRR